MEISNLKNPESNVVLTAAAARMLLRELLPKHFCAATKDALHAELVSKLGREPDLLR